MLLYWQNQSTSLSNNSLSMPLRRCLADGDVRIMTKDLFGPTQSGKQSGSAHRTVART